MKKRELIGWKREVVCRKERVERELGGGKLGAKKELRGGS